VNCIVEQGDRVRLPKTLNEDQVRWLAGEDEGGDDAERAAPATFHDVPLESSWRTDVRDDDEADAKPAKKERKSFFSGFFL